MKKLASVMSMFVFVSVATAFAAPGWRAEFEEVCAATDSAMTLSTDELTQRIARCDRLKPGIEAEDETVRKVYLRRLKMCRDLYAYVLERKQP